MSDKKLTESDKQVVESMRYLESEYCKVKPVAENENRLPSELLDSLLTIVIEARVNHAEAYTQLLLSMVDVDDGNQDLANLESKVLELSS